MPKLPHTVYLIFQKEAGRWELKATATSVKERQAKALYWDNTPGSGAVIWRAYKATNEMSANAKYLR